MPFFRNLAHMLLGIRPRDHAITDPVMEEEIDTLYQAGYRVSPRAGHWRPYHNAGWRGADRDTQQAAWAACRNNSQQRRRQEHG